MWCFRAPAAVVGLIAATFLPSVCAKPYPVHLEELRGLHNASQVERRDCAPEHTCGWYKQLCCTADQSCITNANGEAQCIAGAAQATTGWVYYTTTWVETVGLVTKTSVYSSYVGATTTQACTNAQSPCGSTCCDSGFYCDISSKCALIAGGSSGGILPTVTASAPVRPTSSTVVYVTYTGTPTTTLPFQSAIPTGVNGGLVPVEESSGGLSGGAIAGIVIGVIFGLLLLLLLCLFCCARALFDTLAGILGFGKNKRKHTHEETYVEEHHSSGGTGSGRWYGQGPSRPPREKKSSGVGKGMGVAAGLGALALALGLKRNSDRRNDDKSTTISGSSYYYSDYTSASSASSSDRHTRHTRQSSRR